ncbi:unnamed protein product [Angiostrongylus costaricensis]|uniref:ABC transporter domain-containing protein n=1 Tax=Angiostrongylus costaricensis TaxID=334426 RepID=A0A0R3PC74_ANGCS|nr:unnamed protein product [Angiostrongylus costaricensis]
MLSGSCSSHTLDVRNITFSCNVDRESTFGGLLSPPDVIRVLHDISFVAVSGGVHAIVGSADSGKSVLLEVISLTANGDTAGVVKLDKNALTRRKSFPKVLLFCLWKAAISELHVCTFVPLLYSSIKVWMFFFSGRTRGKGRILNPTLSLNCHVRWDFQLDKLMREFDLLEYCDKKLKDLSAGARRRALIAAALVKDPVLLVAEDPCHGLEPIACFHLMQCLHSYAVENNRIVLTSLMSPRSDICEMISGLTILFRGRVFYSGHIKNLPNYFRRVGLVCPDNENPAMYYCEFELVRCFD